MNDNMTCFRVFSLGHVLMIDLLFARLMHICELCATQAMAPPFEFESKCLGHGDEDRDTGAKWHVVKKTSEVAQE